MSTKIAVCSIGKNPISLIQNLIEYDETIDLSLITMNILDYKPPVIENVATQWQRYELRNVLKQLGIIENISIPESLIDLLKQNDTLKLDDADLTISSHIDQIEANSKDLVTSYNNLQKDTKYDNVSLYPLITTELSLLSFKNKKYAPLRYYYTTETLYDDTFDFSSYFNYTSGDDIAGVTAGDWFLAVEVDEWNRVVEVTKYELQSGDIAI